MIREANINDIEIIMKIVNGTVTDLQAQGNNQWTNEYPSICDFKEDIKNQNLYVYQEVETVVGFIVIDKNEPDEYNNLKWSSNSFVVVHRFAVDNNHHHKGIGTKLLKYAEEIAIINKNDIIKIDTNIKNNRMKNLFKKNNYNYIGEVNFTKSSDPYVCYEKKVRN